MKNSLRYLDFEEQRFSSKRPFIGSSFRASRIIKLILISLCIVQFSLLSHMVLSAVDFPREKACALIIHDGAFVRTDLLRKALKRLEKNEEFGPIYLSRRPQWIPQCSRLVMLHISSLNLDKRRENNFYVEVLLNPLNATLRPASEYMLYSPPIRAPPDRKPLAIVTVCIGINEEYAQTSLLNKQKYAERHNYSSYAVREPIDKYRHGSWNKILALRMYMETGLFKWIWWLDADTLIMNFKLRIEDFVDENYDLIMVKDENGINAGSFLIKNSPFSLDLLDRIYSFADNETIPRVKIEWEQAALIKLMKEDPRIQERTKILPQRAFNSYFFGGDSSMYTVGDFVIHFPGEPLKRQALFDKYAPQVIKE